MSVASSSGCSSLVGYENNNEVNRNKMKQQHQPMINGGAVGGGGGGGGGVVTGSVAAVVGGGGSIISNATSGSTTLVGNNVGSTKHNGGSSYHSSSHHHNHHHHNRKHKSSSSSSSSSKCHGGYEESSSGCGRSHLNSLWSVWYGFFGTLLQAYAAVKCARRFLQYAVLPWNDETTPPPVTEFHASLLLTGVAVLLLPLFLVSAVFKVGNNANDGVKLGRGLSTCSRDPASSLLGAGAPGRTDDNSCGLWRHGGPTAPFLHMVTALCLLLPKLLMEARLIEAGFLPLESIWKTDLDFMVVHRDRLIVLSFMTGATVNGSTPNVPLNTPPLSSLYTNSSSNYTSFYNNFTGMVDGPRSQPFSMVQTLKNILGPENIEVDATGPDAGWGSSVSVEYLNYAVSLLVYSVRYPSVFWSTNKCFGALFSFQLLTNGLQSLLAYAGMSILYKVQMIGPAKALPLLRHHPDRGMSMFTTSFKSPFLLNPHVTLGLFILSGLLILTSSLVLYLYGYGRFNAFINHERHRKIIELKSTNNAGWSYVTHCAALCVLLSVGVCNAPLLHDYTVVYRGSLDGAILACIIGGLLHLFSWIVLWLFLTIKQKWIFKLRVTVGRAAVRSAKSVKLVTDVDLITSHRGSCDDSSSSPLLVVGNGRTYTIKDTSPKKAIMSVIQKAALERKARATESQNDGEEPEGEEQIYWLRPALISPARSPDNEKVGWFNKKLGNTKHKVTFNDIPSTSSSRNKTGFAKARNRSGNGVDEDDGDYATLRELPLAPTLMDPGEDSTSEEGKLLACMQDESVTYASTSRDLVPPVEYEDPSPLLTPEPLSDRDEPDGMPASTTVITQSTCSAADNSVAPINVVNVQLVTAGQGTGNTPRCLRRADSGMPHDEITPRSDSITASEASSVSPPEPPGSNHSESSSGVHSNASSERPQIKPAVEDSQQVWPPAQPSPHKTSYTPPLVSSPQPFSPNITSQPIYGFSSSASGINSPIYVSSTNTSINGDVPEHGVPAVVLESESTVVIRRKPSTRPPPEAVVPIVKDESFGRPTNMRMTSFTEHNAEALRNTQASSATLPHYPTQPIPSSMAYPHCSTMPLPQHSTNNMPQAQPALNSGTSCNAFPRHHTTIPSQLNGVRLYPGNASITPSPFVKRFPSYLHQNGLHARITAAESIYGNAGNGTRISGEIYHYNS